LNALLLLEAMATEKCTSKEILDKIMSELGHFSYDRIDMHLSEERKQKVLAMLKDAPPMTFCGQKVSRVDRLDGSKLVLENGDWILFRASGTEPLLRIYAEAGTQEMVRMLLAAGENLTK
jgi:phosphomannomutase